MMNGDFVLAIAQGNWLALLDVSETWASPSRLDPNRHERASFFRCGPRGFHCFLKCFSVRDHVVGRQYEHCGRVIARCGPASAQRHRCCRVTLMRLSHDILFWEIPEQIANCSFLFGVDENENPFRWNQAFQSLDRFFE